MLENEIKDYKALKSTVAEINGELKELKAHIIDEMNKAKINKIETAGGSIRLSTPTSFSEKKCKTTYFELFVEYLTTESVTTEIFNKDGFKLHHPVEFKKCMIDLTPRLTVK